REVVDREQFCWRGSFARRAAAGVPPARVREGATGFISCDALGMDVRAMAGCSRDGPRRLGISRSTFCCNAVLPSLLLLASGPRLLLLPLAASIHFLWPSPPAPLRRGTDRRGARDDCLDG
ncbi:unnamed protein product, partial [Prorocentrum cordatum]